MSAMQTEAIHHGSTGRVGVVVEEDLGFLLLLPPPLRGQQLLSIRPTELTGESSSRCNRFYLISNLNFTLSAQNPNKKLIYFYDPISISVNLGNDSFPSFVHPTKNTTLLHTTISSPRRALDSSSTSTLSLDLKKNSVPLDIKLETKVKVEMGGFISGKVKIRVHCDGISVAISKGKIPSSSSCQFKLRYKIVKWEL